MDFNALCTKEAHDEGAEMRVEGPDGSLTDFYIKLIGVDSAKWRTIKQKIEKQALLASMTGDKEDGIDAAEYMAEATIGWRGLTENGVDCPFSYEAAKNLYTNAPYICDQADRFIAKRVNFIKA